MRLLIFLLGAGIGAPTRYLIDTHFRSIHKFPTGILVANMFGSFLLGVVSDGNSDLIYGLTGFCGALTTWSAFSLDLHRDRVERDWKLFFGNLFLNYGLGICAAVLGIWVRG